MKCPPSFAAVLRAMVITLTIFGFSFSLITANDSTTNFRRWETDTVNSYGFFIGFGWNKHLTNFQKLPGIPNCCKGFKNGVGSGISAGAFMEIPIPFSLFAGMRATLLQLNGWLKEKEGTWVRIDNDTLIGVFEHNLKTQYTTIGLEPFLRWNFWRGLSIFFGGRLAFPLQKKFNQWESLIEPPDRGVFVDTQSRRRNEYTGNLTEAKSVQADLHFGFEYALPLNKYHSLMLVPTFDYRFGLTNVVNSLDWKINSYHLQLALRYRPIKISKPEEIKPIEEFQKINIFDTIIVENQQVQRNRFAFGREHIDTTIITEPGKIFYKITISRTDTIFKIPKPNAILTTNTSAIHLTTQFVTQAFPLLPIIFFEKNSSVLTDFYKKINGPKEFNYQSLSTIPLELNRDILNIIGYRLKEHPNTKIAIVGYADSTTEGGNCRLARQRAKEVKNYLVKVWEIPPKNIKIVTANENCIPKERTITQNDSGFAENRRVEIHSDDPSILEPVAKRRYLEVLNFEPDTLFLNPTKSQVVALRNWKIEILMGDTAIFSSTNNGPLEIIAKKISNEMLDLLTRSDKLTARLTIIDETGNVSIDNKAIKVINDTSQYETQRLSLILFDVASATIPQNKKDEISKFLKTNSKYTQAKILGYSDILGDKDFNYSLSEKRAQKTLELVKSFDPNIEIIEAKGLGSSKLPPGINSYSTPAERFLSRTVYIELIKKWK